MPSFPESWVQADRFVKAHPELTADDIRSMSMADFAKLTGREPFRPVVSPSRPAPGLAPPLETHRVEIPEPEPEPEPVSVRDMDFAEYEVFRAKIGMGQSTKNNGIFGR